MTPRTVWAESNRVKRAAKFCFVLWMPRQVSQFVVAMSKLTFVAVLARSAFLERPTQFRLVSARVLVALVMITFAQRSFSDFAVLVEEGFRMEDGNTGGRRTTADAIGSMDTVGEGIVAEGIHAA